MEGLSPPQFEQVFRQHYKRLFYYAYDFVQDEDVARDVVSDVFESVWNNRQHILPDKLLPYLMTSIRNKSISHLERSAGRQSFEPTETMELLMAQSEEDLELHEERLDKMQQSLSQLPQKTRYVIEQCYFHDKKYRQVADEMGITTDGVKKHIVTAFRFLRQQFGINKK